MWRARRRPPRLKLCSKSSGAVSKPVDTAALLDAIDELFAGGGSGAGTRLSRYRPRRRDSRLPDES